MPRKIIVIGGSLSGAAAAARIRILDSQAEIILLEKGATITYAGTVWPGLLSDDRSSPRDQQNLSSDEYQQQYHVDVRTNSEVVAIHRLRRLVEIRPASDPHGKVYKERYDILVLAAGCQPVRPAAFADAGEAVFTLKSPADILQIRAYLQRPATRAATVIGGTPAGVQAAAALAGRGLDVVLVEKANHVISSLDPDMARLVEGHLRDRGVRLCLSRQTSQCSRQDGRLTLLLDDQSRLVTDLVILACGNQPDSSLAMKSGLKIGPLGSVLIDGNGQTSDKRIYAVGSQVASVDLISGKPVWLPSAAAVIRQARLAADALCVRAAAQAGTLAISHLALDGLEAGSAGAGESELLTMKAAYNRTYSIIPGEDGQPFLIVKVLWARQTRKLLGAQLVSSAPAADKLAVLALAIQSKQTVDDLSRYDMPNDAERPGRRHWLTQIGQLAQNQLTGLARDFSIYDLAALDTSRVVLVDVRTREEYLNGTIAGAICLPLVDLIAGLQQGRQDLPADKPVYLISGTGRKGFLAARALIQAGRTDVLNLSGGYWLYSRVVKAGSGT